MKRKEVLEILNITPPTLTKYVKQGLVKVDSQINGQYIYNDDSVKALATNKQSSSISMPAFSTLTISAAESDTGCTIDGIKQSELVEALQKITDIFGGIMPVLATLRVLTPETYNAYKELSSQVAELGRKIVQH